MGTERLQGRDCQFKEGGQNSVKMWDETYQKSVQENKKKMPLFLKHFNGWYQNVKLNIQFFKKINTLYLYVTTSEKTKHIKNGN